MGNLVGKGPLEDRLVLLGLTVAAAGVVPVVLFQLPHVAVAGLCIALVGLLIGLWEM